jgi:hypothetical protein
VSLLICVHPHLFPMFMIRSYPCSMNILCRLGEWEVNDRVALLALDVLMR